MDSPWTLGIAGRALPGERVSGDRHVATQIPDGVVIAVIDALGHGAEAETTARRACAEIERHAQEPLPILVERCHRALIGGRGVVLGAATIDGRRGRVTWLGVGTVSGIVLRHAGPRQRRRDLLLPASGIVGGCLPALRPEDVRWAAGDLLMLATDGLREGFADGLSPGTEDPQRLAERLIVEHAREGDDALVVVVRHLGT